MFPAQLIIFTLSLKLCNILLLYVDQKNTKAYFEKNDSAVFHTHPISESLQHFVFSFVEQGEINSVGANRKLQEGRSRPPI